MPILAPEPITPDLVPPMDPLTGQLAPPTGEMFRDSAGDAHIVYKSSFYDEELTKDINNRVPVIDPRTGEQAFRKDVDGNYPLYRFPMRYKEREFILERSPMGEVRMNFNFRPDPGERKEQVQADMVERFERRLATEAVKRGMARDLGRQFSNR